MLRSRRTKRGGDHWKEKEKEGITERTRPPLLAEPVEEEETSRERGSVIDESFPPSSFSSSLNRKRKRKKKGERRRGPRTGKKGGKTRK